MAPVKAAKYVYSFGAESADGNGNMKELLGGKGANLAEMAKIGLPVPSGFTITTEVCTAFYKNNKKYPAGLKKEVAAALKKIEKEMGAKFGDPRNPLLLSCRSGARASMPGMMDTVLNIGLNEDTVQGLLSKTNNPRFVYDSYRRFIAMYGDVVMGIKAAQEKAEDPFELLISELKQKKGYVDDAEMTAEDLQQLAHDFKVLIKDRLQLEFPEDPMEQLWGAIGAVFESWMTPRAVAYRKINDLPSDWGTAVNVQAMVFGNMGDDSATGVAFSRDPATGDNYFYGEYLTNAQGEDVVAGIRTPSPINHVLPVAPGVKTLSDIMPEQYRELDKIRTLLENHYRDMQDLEFTIQQKKLWILQCRAGKRTAKAALKIAVDLVKEKKITPDEALLRLMPEQLNQLLLPTFDPKAEREVLAQGLPASPGAAVGQVVFAASEAEELAARGERVILVRLETSPEDIKGMHAAQGILTARGGMTSHAAVVGRGMGKTCVVGAADIYVDYAREEFTTKSGYTVKKGDWISLDGGTGCIMKGRLETIDARLTGDFATFMKWVQKAKNIGVRTNADTPRDAQVAREFGAEGIGLCRTEHMFFEEDRITSVREMILASDEDGRKAALNKLLPMQREDFYRIFKVMDGMPVTIRTLDPPLHEFLVKTEKEIEELAAKIGHRVESIKAKLAELHEANPMLGLRGCRLGIQYPEITAMQARAIFEAASRAIREKIKVIPEIMIPLIGHEREFREQKAVIDRVAREVMESEGVKIKYRVGTMIELPRAALTADRIAGAGAEFFSFGTNDLTQFTYGLSRDDAKFIPTYLSDGIWSRDPFVNLDENGVGQLVKIGIDNGRSVVPGLKVGICGEHGGDPRTIHFCCDSGMDYVSCSPFRVPIARLAAAQHAILSKKRES
ncbi:MAG: pyruvate, phosphate dikinase [Desulfovibrionaceae bacterium]|nr:pyruvate, phosphate dikinase [Desulfovibrionaceae bacterium]